MSPGQVEVRVDHDSVAGLRDWSSLWADLLHVDMVLLARDEVAIEARNVFTRRALWESAVISYGRTASTGRRRSQIEELLELLDPGARAFHQEVMSWRNQHVAHRVDRSREQTEARAVIDPESHEIKAIHVRVSPVLGPEDEKNDLVNRFKKYVKELRDLAWTKRIGPEERKAIQENSGDVMALLAKGESATLADSPFSVHIDPNGATD